MSDLRNRIYIGKLHYDVREKDIERFFKDFGKINDINMKNGYAFVVSYIIEHFHFYFDTFRGH